MNNLIQRNLRIFFRDKMNVFFALLSSLIMFILYVVFLGALQVQSIQQSVPGLSDALANHFVNSWVFAGIITITAVTTSLGALNVFIVDRSEGRLKDFAVSPVRQWKLVVSYLSSAVVISFMLTLLVAIVGQVYVMIMGGDFIGWTNVWHVLLIILLLTIVFSAFACLIATFIKSGAAFTSASIIIGTSVGFLAGVYVPIGALSAGIQSFMNVLPFSQAAALIREPFSGDALNNMHAGGLTGTNDLHVIFGYSLHIGDTTIAASTSVLVLVAFALICTAVAVIRMAKVLKSA